MAVFMKQWYQFNNAIFPSDHIHISKATNHSAYLYCNPNKPKSQNDCLVISTRWWQQCKTRVLWSHVLCNHLRRTYRRLFLLNISGVTAVGDDPPQIDLPPTLHQLHPLYWLGLVLHDLTLLTPALFSSQDKTDSQQRASFTITSSSILGVTLWTPPHWLYCFGPQFIAPFNWLPNGLAMKWS